MKKIASMAMLLTLLPTLGMNSPSSSGRLDPGANSLLLELPRAPDQNLLKATGKPLRISLTVIDTRWEDSQFPPRKKLLELQKELNSVHRKRIFLNPGGLSALTSKPSYRMSQPGTMSRTAIDAQASKIEDAISSLTQLAQTEISWAIETNEQNNEPFEVNLAQLLQHFKSDSLEPFEIEIKVTSNQAPFNKILFRGSLSNIYKTSQNNNWSSISVPDSGGLEIKFYRRPDFMNLILPESNTDCLPCYFRN